MVKSGLSDTAIKVSDVRLAIHFITAATLLCYILWMAFSLSIPIKPMVNSFRLKNTAGITFSLLLIQLFFGALMAGSHAALSAPTWPDMNGYFIPPELLTLKPGAGNTYLLAV